MAQDKIDLQYLQLLATKYPNRERAFSKIISLQAMRYLPKGTEHFVSDIHGEYEAFCHILNNCSGVIREKVQTLFDLSKDEQDAFCTLIYYPKEVLKQLEQEGRLSDIWYKTNLERLILLCKFLSSKYTRSRVREAINQEYAYIIDELLHAQQGEYNSRAKYHDRILDTIISTGSAHHFVSRLCALAKNLAVDHLHVVGDIYDRGAAPDKVMQLLMSYHSLDIQWGNHDILWMGAACGSQACVATILRNNINYFNCNVLESAYGISLRRLESFAYKYYKTDKEESPHDLMMQAITIIALKLQGQIIQRNPLFKMDSSLLLDKIDYDNKTVTIEGKTYPLKHTFLPTIDLQNPYALTEEEQVLIDQLTTACLNSRELQKEAEFLFSHGSIYKCYNGNLLYHGCIPLNNQGAFREIETSVGTLKGKAWLDYCEQMARHAWSQKDLPSLDFMYFLWCGVTSPLSGRIMKPFARFFIADPTSHHEPRDPYYDHYYKEEVCISILKEFGLDPDKGHIINGHTPIKVKEGESPIRGNGKLLVIDGGLCEAYHKTTGIAGYTLIDSSHDLILKAHRPFESTQKAIAEHLDIMSDVIKVEVYSRRLTIADTDFGKTLAQSIKSLEALLEAYREGIIPEDSVVPDSSALI